MGLGLMGVEDFEGEWVCCEKIIHLESPFSVTNLMTVIICCSNHDLLEAGCSEVTNTYVVLNH